MADSDSVTVAAAQSPQRLSKLRLRFWVSLHCRSQPAEGHGSAAEGGFESIQLQFNIVIQRDSCDCTVPVPAIRKLGVELLQFLVQCSESSWTTGV